MEFKCFVPRRLKKGADNSSLERDVQIKPLSLSPPVALCILVGAGACRKTQGEESSAATNRTHTRCEIHSGRLLASEKNLIIILYCVQLFL